MLWAPTLVRLGETLFASGLETLPDFKPLHNVRWTFWKRDATGWKLQQVDPKERTREPCPLVGFPDGRLLMSVNPTLVTDPERHAGPARPELLEFSAADPKQPPKTLSPAWDGDPPFAEHSYRFFGADAAAGEALMLNQISYSHKEWALLKRDGTWAAGKLMNVPSRPGDIHAYRPPYNLHRTNYGSVVLQDRAAYVTGCVSYANWDRAGEKELAAILEGKSARVQLGSLANRRRMMFTWTPDITAAPFREWVEVGSTMANGGWLFPGDLWVAPDGAAHVLWYEGPMPRRLRDERFPERQADARHQACHGARWASGASRHADRRRRGAGRRNTAEHPATVPDHAGEPVVCLVLCFGHEQRGESRVGESAGGTAA